MKTYEAWIEGKTGTRIIQIEATSNQAAFAKAKAECTDGEFCRGVVEVDAS